MQIIMAMGLSLGAYTSAIADMDNCNLKDKLSLHWQQSNFQNPESTLYDAKNNIIYVSNLVGGGGDKDGIGFISKLNLDGTIETLKWVSGLNAPKGMAIYNNSLFVSDIDQLIEIDISTGTIKKRYTIANANLFFNDVTIDNSGDVYVSDTISSSIYRLSKGKLALWLSDTALENPNGLYIEGDQLLVASWGVITDLPTFGTKTPGHILSVSLKDKKILNYGGSTPIGNMDGIVPDGKGQYFLTNWRSGELIYHQPKKGKSESILKLTNKIGAADLDYIQDKKLLIIPLSADSQVRAYKVK